MAGFLIGKCCGLFPRVGGLGFLGVGLRGLVLGEHHGRSLNPKTPHVGSFMGTHMVTPNPPSKA